MPRAACVFLLVVAFAVLSAEVRVHAYLDPGAGSILFQVLLGGVAAVGVIVRLFWRSLSAPFRKRESEDKKHL